MQRPTSSAAVVVTLLLSAQALVSAPAVADEVLWDSAFPWMGERKILGTNNLEAIEATSGSAEYDSSKPVARVEMSADSYGFCTGSRISETLFLTNFHCDLGCETMQFRLGYEKDLPADSQPVFKCKQLLRKNETLDYAIFEVEAAIGAGAAYADSYPALALSAAPLAIDQKVIVSSHPKGRLKEIDRSTSCVVSTTEPFLTESGRNTIKHMCDTEGGSSGSPVIDRESGAAVALHWGGKDNEYNMAIPMALIVADLRANAPATLVEQLTIVGE